MPKQPLRDIVIVLPGITGSVLQKDGRDVWAPSAQAALGALRTWGAALQSFRLTADDPEAEDLGDGIRATRLVPDVHLIPGLVKIDGYSQTLRLVEDNFEVTRGSIDDDGPANLFEFPYDWRRDNRFTARQLKRLVDRRLPQWREASGASDARVILIGHSMGGLVSRYYLEVLEGWRDCRALITFGTPFRGSPNAINYLANGYKQLFLDLTDVMRSFTAVYQLLPIYKSVEINGAFHRVAETDGIPGIDRARAAQALAFHREIEAAVAEHRKSLDYLEQGYRILPVVGTRQPTFQSAQVAHGRVTVGEALPAGIDARLGDGDGTVPMLSAIPIELSQAYQDTFIPERHGSLQRNPEVLQDLRDRLMRMQIVGLEGIRDIADVPGALPSPRAAERPALALHLDDAYVQGEPVAIAATVVNAQAPIPALEAHVENLTGQGAPSVHAFRNEGARWSLALEALPPGTYRLSVQPAGGGPDRPSAVHDVFEVVA